MDCDHGPCIGHTFDNGWVMYTYTEDLARVSFHHPDHPDEGDLPLKSYDVEVKATVLKTITVEASDGKSAAEQAHELFTLHCDGNDEHYEQDTHSVKETTHE